jgi:hypothetical protein
MAMPARRSRIRIWRSTALGGLLAASACGPGAVTSERNDAVPIPAGASVEFRGSTSDASPRVDPAVANDSVHHMIQRAIIAQLRQKGYTIVDTTKSATFTVQYFLGVSPTKIGYAATAGGVSGPKVGGYRGAGYGYGQPEYTNLASQPLDTVKNVSFEVALVDLKAGRTAWRGLYNAEPKNQAPSAERINSVVADVFKSLPRVP